ncbi:uncharacterized protein ACRADG_002272 [Cochliomyia hominivorax]
MAKVCVGLLTLQEQVNLIWLSKVIKDIKILKQQTGINLIDIHDILKNQKTILEEWKKKYVYSKNNSSYLQTDDWDGIDALLLEWITQSKINQIDLPFSAINLQVSRLKEYFQIPSYRVRHKMWSSKLLHEKPNKPSSSSPMIIQDPIEILTSYGKRLLKPHVYYKFLAIHEHNLRENEMRANTSLKVMEEMIVDKYKEEEESNITSTVPIEDIKDSDVVCIEKPIETINICNENEDETTFSNDVFKDSKTTLVQNSVELQEINEDIQEISTRDFPSMKTIKLMPENECYGNVKIKEEPPDEVPIDYINNFDEKLIKKEIDDDEFLDCAPNNEEFIECEQNTKKTELSALRNSPVGQDITIKEENENEEETETFKDIDDNNEVLCEEANLNSGVMSAVGNSQHVVDDDNEEIHVVLEIGDSDGEEFKDVLLDLINKYDTEGSEVNVKNNEEKIKPEPPDEDAEDEEIITELEIIPDENTANDEEDINQDEDTEDDITELEIISDDDNSEENAKILRDLLNNVKSSETQIKPKECSSLKTLKRPRSVLDNSVLHQKHKSLWKRSKCLP